MQRRKKKRHHIHVGSVDGTVSHQPSAAVKSLQTAPGSQTAHEEVSQTAGTFTKLRPSQLSVEQAGCKTCCRAGTFLLVSAVDGIQLRAITHVLKYSFDVLLTPLHLFDNSNNN